MTTIDRNKLEIGTIVRWLNGGWVLAEIAERDEREHKVVYRTKPINGMKEFGGASNTTGWPVSVISADCLIDFGPDSADTLTPPNVSRAYGQSRQYHEGKVTVLPEYVPQDRNMFAVWRDAKEQKVADAGGSPVVEVRVRTRVRPGVTA